MRNNEERLGAQINQQAVEPPQQLFQQQNSAPQGLSFIAVTEFVDLPSKGRFYPEGHPLKGKETIEVKQMTAKEEDILTNRSFLKKGVALDKLLESIVLDKSINTQELLVCDRNSILVSARITGYGNEYITQVTCPSCEKKVRNRFDLLEKVEEWQEDAKPVEVAQGGTFKITLPATKWVVECRALNGNDEKRLLNYVTSKNKEDFTLMDQLKMLIVSIQGVTDQNILQQALEAMPAADSKFLRKEYDKVIPSLNLKNNFTCKECGFEEVMEVPLTADFFWPK